jgi:cobalt-zinc-cadmium efflux system membrane fusion protein
VWVTKQQITETGLTTAEVGEYPVGSALVATGRIAFSDVRVAHVFSPVTGRVTNLLAGLGQTVSRGAPLAIIRSPDLAAAISDVQKSEADLSAARRDYERQKELYEAHAAAQRDFEAAESNFQKAKAERDRASEKSKLLLVSDRASSSEGFYLRAPIEGEVLARNVAPGTEVQGQYSGGNAVELFTIGNLNRVCVLADVFELDSPHVRIGAPVSVSVVAYPDRSFAGNVDWISGSLDPATRTVKVRCTIDNVGHLLKPEMYATVSIAGDSERKLAVPRSAVLRIGNDIVAYVDRGPAQAGGQERFERRLISVDENRAGAYVPVTRGLQRGERVVSSGAILLSGSGQ